MTKAEKLLILLEMSVQDAFTVFGIEPSEFDPDELKKKYRDLSKKHHPDHGGDTETMQKITVAYDILKKVKKQPTVADREANRKQQETEYKKRASIVIPLIRKAFDANAYKTYFEKMSNIPLIHTEDEKVITGRYGSYDVIFTHEFHTENRETVFHIKIDINLLNVDFTKTLGGGDGTVNFSFYVDHYLYHNKRQQKMKRRTWDFKNSTAQIVKPADLFPTATLKKVFAGKKQRKFSKRDFIEGIKKEMGGSYDGDFARIPIKDEITLVIYRSTFMRTAVWGPNGLYEKYKRVEQLSYMSLPETEETLGVLVVVVNKMKKASTVKKMADIYNKEIKVFIDKIRGQS